jgi:hypothetical protein
MDDEVRRLLCIAAALAVNGHAVRREYGQVCAAVAIVAPVLYTVDLLFRHALTPVQIQHLLLLVFICIGRSAIVAGAIGLPFLLWRRFAPSLHRDRVGPRDTAQCPFAPVAQRAATFTRSLRISTCLLWGLVVLVGVIALVCTDERSERQVDVALTDGEIKVDKTLTDYDQALQDYDKGSTDYKTLMRAVERGDVAAIGPLNRGIRPTDRGTGWRGDNETPLNAAVRRGDRRMVTLFLDRGANVNGGSGDWFDMPLAVAAEREDTEMIRLLIHRGATINQTVGGSAALRSAAVNGRVASVRFLLKRGADPNTSTEAGTLLHAVRADDPKSEIAHLLVQAGAHE